jgi:protocatechuate 3,4-dioxygenase beta subunit
MNFHSPFSSLSRREALRLLSGTTLTLLGSRWASAAIPTPSLATPAFSILTPEVTEGPYYIDLERMRRDITEGKPGVPLRMRVRVLHLTTGAPIPSAAVDVWHCDAQGVYSGFSGHLPPPRGQDDRAFEDMEFFEEMDELSRPDSGNRPPPSGPPGGPGFGPGFGHGPTHKPDNKETFLRGVQLTDENGLAEIDTIFPGWYQGRTTHIHLRIHDGGLVADGRYKGGHISHTGQIFFPEETTTHIYRLPAYAKNQDGRMFLKDDGIYLSQSTQPLARLTPIDPQNPDHGFFSDSSVVIDPAATPGRF